MAYLAARTDPGTRKQVNEDACCIEVAQTALGEVVMAVVCDGVGGLARGNVASSTVIDRFVRWFAQELPAQMAAMPAGTFGFDAVREVWQAHLDTLNERIRAYGQHQNTRLGTTFTGIIACGGRYLVGHVGDCRAYQMNAGSFAQITEDQTVVAKRLAAGEITPEEARRMPQNVILQSVGTERVLRPVFGQGSYDANDLFVICCDGAYKRAGNEGVRQLFQALDYRDEVALDGACQALLRFDMDCGERDNLTVACFSGALADAAGRVAPAPARPAVDAEDELPTVVESLLVGDEDDLPTMVDAGDTGAEDDLPTMVDAGEPVAALDDDDLPTMVDGPDLPDDDDLPTMVEPAYEGPEDDLPTMVDGADMPGGPAEDDLPTMVAMDDEPAPNVLDDDDLPTMVEGGDA